jgi:hypothetical protein
MHRFAFILLALLIAPVAFASSYWEAGALRITFTQAPCRSEAMALFLAQRNGPSKAHEALIVWQGKPVQGCWSHDADGDYTVLDRDGSGATIYKSAVRPVRGSS